MSRQARWRGEARHPVRPKPTTNKTPRGSWKARTTVATRSWRKVTASLARNAGFSREHVGDPVGIVAPAARPSSPEHRRTLPISESPAARRGGRRVTPHRPAPSNPTASEKKARGSTSTVGSTSSSIGCCGRSDARRGEATSRSPRNATDTRPSSRTAAPDRSHGRHHRRRDPRRIPDTVPRR